MCAYYRRSPAGIHCFLRVPGDFRLRHTPMLLSARVSRSPMKSARKRQAHGHVFRGRYRAVRARVGHGFPARQRQVRQRGHGVAFLSYQHVTVAAHGQVDIAVPHEALGLTLPRFMYQGE